MQIFGYFNKEKSFLDEYIIYIYIYIYIYIIYFLVFGRDGCFKYCK